MDLFARMQSFTRVVEAGSLSAAARDLNVGVAAISKQLASLETHLDTRLLSRSTHAIRLTEAGESYYQKCLEVLAAVEDSEAAVGRSRRAPVGTLRVSCTVAFATHRLIPALPDFLEACPDLSIDLLMQDARVDLIRAGVDVAIRFGVLDDADLMARRICRDERCIAASTAYIDRKGRPEAIADLAKHDVLLMTQSGRKPKWTLLGDEGPEEVDVRGPMRVNSAMGLRSAVLSGLGCAMAPRWLFEAELASGEVTELLPDAPPAPLDLHALYPRSRHPTPRTRAFLDFLSERFGGA